MKENSWGGMSVALLGMLEIVKFNSLILHIERVKCEERMRTSLIYSAFRLKQYEALQL